MLYNMCVPPVALSISLFGVGSAVMVVDSLFITSEMCSVHLLDWVSSVVIGVHSLSLTILALVCVYQSMNYTNLSALCDSFYIRCNIVHVHEQPV